MRLPFAHLNLRKNPFGEVPAAERGRLAVADVERFVEPLESGLFAVEFIGDSGRGKTTHMRALWDRFAGAPFIKVAEHPEGFSAPSAPVVFVDEAQFLERSTRRELFDRGASYVIGTHESLAGHFEQAGLDYESVHLAGVTPDKLEGIIDRRIEWARRGPGVVPQVSLAAVEALIERHGDDLRAIEHHLYEVFQSLEESERVQVSHLDRN